MILVAELLYRIAKLFGESLKAEYDPTGEDLLIERIVIMMEQGTLQ